MSSLSEILNVEEGKPFKYKNNKYIFKIEEGCLKIKTDKGEWVNFNATLCFMINHPENIIRTVVKSELTERQITAIKGRIAEGFVYVAKDGYRHVFVFNGKPFYKTESRNLIMGVNEVASRANENIFNFVEEGDIIYLPDLIGGTENE